MVSTVVIIPTVMLMVWLVLQFAITAHARHLVQAAAQDAAVAQARYDAPAGTATDVATNAITATGSRVARNIRIEQSTGRGMIVVTVTADVVNVVPFLSPHVSATASAPVEEFTPEPNR